MLSIHNNLSAGTQNVIGALTTRLHDKAAVRYVANNARKTQKLFVQGYNLEVHDVIKYTSCHCIKLIISYANQAFV